MDEGKEAMTAQRTCGLPILTCWAAVAATALSVTLVTQAPAAEPDSERTAEAPDEVVYFEYSRALRPVEDYDANRSLSPNEFAELMEKEYGRGSVLGRSAAVLAAVADAAERGSQASLDKVNLVTKQIAIGTHKIFRLREVPDFRLKSQVRLDRVGVGLKTAW